MKPIQYFLFSIIFLTVLLTNCQEEEMSAPPVVSELKAYPGKYRAKVEFQAPAGSISGRVFYGNGEYIDFTIDEEKEIQSLIVEGLPEGEQILRVITFNKEGINSDPKGTKVTVYGDEYQQDLVNRTLLTQKTLSPTSIEMTFGNSAIEEVGVRIVFQNISGVKDSVMMNSNQQSIIINDIDLGDQYYFYTVYKPTSDCIDEFTTPRVDAKEAAMKNFEKEVWEINGFSDEDPEKTSSNIIDNNELTIWHSGITSPSHWISVDMQSEKIFNGFIFQQSRELGETGFCKGVRFETSSDNENWTVTWEGNLKDHCYRQTIQFQDQVVARYFKVTTTSGYNSGQSSQIAEIDLFNELNVSGTSGETLPQLANAKPPFETDGSDLFPAVGANRMQKVTQWIHSSNAYISFDKVQNTFCVWSAAVWGIPLVTNGKIYQNMEILPGNYVLKIDVGHTTSPDCVDMYGIVAKGTTLPDYDNVTSAPEVLGYSDLVANQQTIVSIPFTIEQKTVITIGIVYNTHDIFATTGIPWSDMYIKGFELTTK